MILNHRLCYSKKDEMLTAKEMALKLGITRESVYAAENTLERKISDIIRKFKGVRSLHDGEVYG